MLYIREVIVSPEQEEHVWSKHRVTPEEVEQVCFSEHVALRGRDRSYAIYGRTDAGRYLVAILYPRGRRTYSLATAREMTHVERRRFHELSSS